MSVPSHDVVAVPLKIGGIFHKHSHDEWMSVLIFKKPHQPSRSDMNRLSLTPLLLPRSSLIKVVSKCFWQINCVHSQDHCPSPIYQLFACVPPNIPMLSEIKVHGAFLCQESAVKTSARALLLRLLDQLRRCLRSWTDSEREWVARS